MFGVFSRRPNFETIFSSQSETRKYIYGDRGKTSAVLGDQGFIEAWLASKSFPQVTAVIGEEALKGDIPSLKQMIWFCSIAFEDVDNRTRDNNLRLQMKTGFLQQRVMYCQKAIEHGEEDQSYYAMTSSAKLYLLRSNLAIDDPITLEALGNIVKYAKHFIAFGSDERELVEDAKRALEYYGPQAKLLLGMHA
jgi:hypothetical protein